MPVWPDNYQLVANITPVPEIPTWVMLLFGFAIITSSSMPRLRFRNSFASWLLAICVIFCASSANAVSLPDNGSVTFYQNQGTTIYIGVTGAPDSIWPDNIYGNNYNSLFDATFTLTGQNASTISPDPFLGYGIAAPGEIRGEAMNCGNGAGFCSPIDMYLVDGSVSFTILPGQYTLNIASYEYCSWGDCLSYSLQANISPVPEPSTWVMMLLGFVGVGLASRRFLRPHRIVVV
jgi:hypothetical protein